MHWENLIPIRFVQRTTQPNFVIFQMMAGGGGSSWIGMIGGQQDIFIGNNAGVPVIIHEIGHAVGIWHEQSREDRDEFVSVIWPNVDVTKAGNFEQNITDGDDVGNYDYCSIMYYPPNAWSVNGQPTIMALRGDLPCFATLGLANGLSPGDVEAVIKLYGGWEHGTFINTSTSGPGCIIQSDFKSRDRFGVEHRNFEVVVQEGSNLVHYWHNNTNRRWSRGGTITNAATGPGCIIQSDFKSPDSQGVMHGNFEVVVLEGNNLVHYWHNNTNRRWTRFRNISTRATRAGSILQSDFGARNHKNYEAIVPEGPVLAHYFDDNRLM